MNCSLRAPHCYYINWEVLRQRYLFKSSFYIFLSGWKFLQCLPPLLPFTLSPFLLPLPLGSVDGWLEGQAGGLWSNWPFPHCVVLYLLTELSDN